MLLTKFTHACVRLEKDGTAIVLDPGTFSEVEEAVDGAAAVLITHEHADHFDKARIAAAVRAGMGLAPEERKSQALLLDQSLVRNFSLSTLPRFSSSGFVRRGDENAAAPDATVPDVIGGDEVLLLGPEQRTTGVSDEAVARALEMVDPDPNPGDAVDAADAPRHRERRRPGRGA